MSFAEFAPAKVNLALHVTGRRADGYHLLDSLVTFASVGDRLQFEAREGGCVLDIEGPEASDLTSGPDNLILRAARAVDADAGAAIRLEKRLPVASGIGGGSADAAAALRGLSRLWGKALPDDAEVLRLGADVPVCLLGRSTRMAGIGEHLTAVPKLPPVWAVLANPRVGVSTPAVFEAMRSRDNAPLPRDIPRFAEARDLALWLADQRNDMEEAAIGLAPQIGQVLTALASLEGALLSRMSGSGATCFALFASQRAAEAAAADLRRAAPQWWVEPARLGDTADFAR